MKTQFDLGRKKRGTTKQEVFVKDIMLSLFLSPCADNEDGIRRQLLCKSHSYPRPPPPAQTNCPIAGDTT